MPCAVIDDPDSGASSLSLRFEQALTDLPDGFVEGQFDGRPWSVTIKRSADGRRNWLFGEELGGTDIVSFNYYRLNQSGATLKPCEMSSAKVIEFVLGFEPMKRNVTNK